MFSYLCLLSINLGAPVHAVSESNRTQGTISLQGRDTRLAVYKGYDYLWRQASGVHKEFLEQVSLTRLENIKLIYKHQLYFCILSAKRWKLDFYRCIILMALRYMNCVWINVTKEESLWSRNYRTQGLKKTSVESHTSFSSF